MSNINQLKSLMSSKGGAARSNLYSVQLPSLGGVSSENLNVLCTRATLPGRTLQTYDKNIGIKYEKVVYGAVNVDIDMSFLVMNDYGARKYFETWQALAYDADRYQIKYKNDYAAQIKVNQLKKGLSFPSIKAGFNTSLPGALLGRLPTIGPLSQIAFDLNSQSSDTIVYSCTLFDAFPVAFEATSLNNEMDGLVQLDVTFNYTKWTSGTTETFSGQDLLETVLGTGLSQIVRGIDRIFN